MEKSETNKWDIVEQSTKPCKQSEKRLRLSQIKQEGHLNKWMNAVRGWKRCYFSLHNGVFKYSHKQKDIDQKSVVVNLTSALISKERSKHSTRFVIDTGTLIMNLRAKTYAEREDWVSALVETQELLNPSELKENSLAPTISRQNPSPRNSLSIEPTVIKQPVLSDSESRHSERSGGAPVRERFQEKLHSLGNIKQQLNKSEESKKKKHHKKEDLAKLREELLEIVNSLTNDTLELIRTLDSSNTSLVVDKTSELEAKKPVIGTDRETKPKNTKLTPRETKKEKEDKYTNTSDADSEEYFDAEEDDQWNEDDSSSFSQSAQDIFPKATTTPTSPKTTETPVGDLLTKKGSVLLRRTLVASVKAKAPVPRSEKQGISFEDILASVPETFKPRTQLPYFRDDNIKLNLAKFLKDAIGKDLTRISMPVVFSEPLSLVQRLAEEYASCSEVLDKAVKSNDAALRLAYVAAFAVSCYASTPDRLYKPFNSILGETYELIDRQKRWRLLSEQVSHHPPVSACICEGEGWTIWGHAEVKTKFWGKSLEINPIGAQTVTFHHTGDQFNWNKVTTIINNVILGNKWVDHYGEMIVINHSTGDMCKLNFEKTVVGWLGSSVPLNAKVTGVVVDKINQPKYKIDGTWTDFLDAIPFTVSGDLIDKNKIRLWERAPWPSNLKEQYNYTSFAIAENELPTFLRPYLPITDTRFRTDQRAFENGDFDLAQEEKTRMEEVQRSNRKKLEENNIEYCAKWFRLEPESNTYVYKGGYWEQRMKRKWENVENVFGLDLSLEEYQPK